MNDSNLAAMCLAFVAAVIVGTLLIALMMFVRP